MYICVRLRSHTKHSRIEMLNEQSQFEPGAPTMHGHVESRCELKTRVKVKAVDWRVPVSNEVNLHRLISAAIGRWWPLTQPNYHFSPGGKSCALAPLNIIPKFPKEKYKFLSEFSSKSNTFVCSICMIAKGYKVFPWKLCQSKNSVCDESLPKRRTVAETFAWRL